MSECAHNTNAEFNLRYSEKDTIKLEPYLCICIDLKIALEILATTIIQLAFRNSLVEKKINIKGEIIDTEYIGNIIAMLQNDSEKAYIIEPNKKIAQTIFLFLVKIAQLVLVENRKKLGIMARGIQDFRSMSKIVMLLNNFNDIFASENKFGRTDIIQHQIKTKDAMPIKQKAYKVLSASHEIIHQEIN
ncbi:hypothetical protein G9A89_005842 [Geosiphon pyriformis]|nr:hypothetical protein G9A89_005842 [Geosiphon pyriformis]